MTGGVVAVFGSSRTRPGTPDWDDAVFVGAELARSGLKVVTGGYGGTMEAVSKGAVEAGGEAIGVTASILFPGRPGANRYVTTVEDANTLPERVGRMLELASACVAMPGSIGTAAELAVAWHVNHVLRRGGSGRMPVAAVGPQWDPLRGALVDGLGAVSDDVHWAPTAKEAVEWVLEQLAF